ncbi:hypothetical protein OS31_40220 [Dickeya oryzae]
MRSQKNMEMVRQFQTNEGLTLIDGEDEFETHSYSFSGLSDLLAEFKEEISGATGIPLIRLFGQSPKGFSSGDADLANYYDSVSTLQERRLRIPVRMLYDALHRSEFGEPLPDDFTFEFNPLWQLSDLDRSTVAVNTVNALSTAVNSLGMSESAALTDLRELADVTGIGASITDEEIESAKIEPPPTYSDNPEPEQAGGESVPDKSTGDSAFGGGHYQRPLRWFERFRNRNTGRTG